MTDASSATRPGRRGPCPALHELPSPPPGRRGWPWVEETGLLPSQMPDGRQWPRISIVTPSYNQFPFIEETIRSVLLQGYPNLEYIVMDGGSTDGSIEVIRKYEPWLSCLRIGPDGGQSAAIAEGFRQATGEILAWLNSDDRYLPGALMRVAQYLQKHPRIVFINSDVNHVGQDGGLIGRSYVVGSSRVITANIGSHGWMQPGCFWRREAYQACGGMDESLQFCMDRDLFLRLTGVGPARRLPGPPLAEFRHHQGAKSSTMLAVARAEHQRLLAKYSSRSLRRMRVALRLWWEWKRCGAEVRKWLHSAWGLEF